MAIGRILIVAPDLDLRRSLEFALEAEGYDVRSCRTIGDEDHPEAYDCTVLDHRAIPGPAPEMLAYCRRARPFVLLAGAHLPWLAQEAYAIVQKPLLGAPLSGAVRDAIAARSVATIAT
jgi:hypothetical protein